MSYPSLDFEDRGFNVVVMDQIGAPSYSLLHEIGHNMGCTHNREDAMNRGIPDTDPSNNSIFKAFNYGKRWIVDGQGYRTIMAYDTEDTSTYNNRIPYFSNPLIQYQGVTTGNLNSEDNAQVLSVTTPYVANFRKSLRSGNHSIDSCIEHSGGKYEFSNHSFGLSAFIQHINFDILRLKRRW